ncbi:hypothetical protein VE03_04236 [Pseudogymnoascus sp. 23342-1-I1]|nr:hypothetical protein VE03_04236 [Pseudogymnoascus sp. 23342-1-I1]
MSSREKALNIVQWEEENNAMEASAAADHAAANGDYDGANIAADESAEHAQNAKLKMGQALSTPERADTQPDRPRWENPGGWRARHISDTASFNLWDEKKRRYRMPERGPEFEWCREKFGDGSFSQPGCFTTIGTSSPPQPAPFTLGGMPLIIHPPPEDIWEMEPCIRLSPKRIYYANPRVTNPCPEVTWEHMTFPTPSQNAEILTALAPLAAVRKVIYMPYWSVAELEVGDGRVYKPGSLPGRVGGRTMLYHHAEEPFFDGMKEMVSCSPLKGANSGGWFEIGGGEVAMLAWAEVYVKLRPVLGVGEVGVGEWERRSQFRVFGDVSEEMRGVPI